MLVSDSPVSVEELSPGSLCDLTRCGSRSLSLLTFSPSLSLFPALRRRYNGWRGRGCPWPWPPPCSLATEEDEVRGREEVAAAPCGSRSRISGMEDCCWEAEPPIASSWEQLLASMAWRHKTGDLEDDTGEFKRFLVDFGFGLLDLIPIKLYNDE